MTHDELMPLFFGEEAYPEGPYFTTHPTKHTHLVGASRNVKSVSSKTARKAQHRLIASSIPRIPAASVLVIITKSPLQSSGNKFTDEEGYTSD